MAKLIHYVDLRGAYHDIPADQLEYRPSVYGFVVHHGRLLLFRSAVSGTWMLPGGKIELGETAIEALDRESREEVGLGIEQPEFFYADDQFYYNETKGQAYQVYSMYYRARPVLRDGQLVPADGAETAELQWVPLADVHPQDFHVSGMDAAKKFLDVARHG